MIIGAGATSIMTLSSWETVGGVAGGVGGATVQDVVVGVRVRVTTRASSGMCLRILNIQET
jgi:hypothetical protein